MIIGQCICLYKGLKICEKSAHNSCRGALRCIFIQKLYDHKSQKVRYGLKIAGARTMCCRVIMSHRTSAGRFLKAIQIDVIGERPSAVQWRFSTLFKESADARPGYIRCSSGHCAMHYVFNCNRYGCRVVAVMQQISSNIETS